MNSLCFYFRRAEYITNIKESSVTSSSSFISPSSSEHVGKSEIPFRNNEVTSSNLHRVQNEYKGEEKGISVSVSVSSKIIIIWTPGFMF